MTNRENTHTARHWDSNPRDRQEIVYWTQLPSVSRRLAIKESGRPDGNWVDHTLETYFAQRLPLSRCLSLGCGRGRVERQWAEKQAFLACDAYDLSSASIADAEKLAVEAGYFNIHYSVADIDQIALPAQSYDAVWAVSSAHHFNRLEHVFGQVAQALKPNGLFILHEYVGANHFQFPDRQRQVIEACLNLLPLQYRLLPAHAAAGSPQSTESVRQRDLSWITRRIFDKVREGSFRSTAERYWRRRQSIRTGQRPIKETAVPELGSVVAVDPSEAVRSAEIIPILMTRFDIVEYRPLGGSILQFLLAGIAGNFQDEEGEQLLEVFFELEDSLIACGDLTSDFAYIVASPRMNESH